MSTPGGQPEEPWEQRIRPAPRPVRPAPLPEEIPEITPPPPPPALGEASPVVRPDRSRMDPLSLDRSTSRRLLRLRRGEVQARHRGQRSKRVDRWLMRGTVLLVAVVIAGGVVWIARQRFGFPVGSQPPQADTLRPVVPSPDRVLDMLEHFLTAPGVPAKAAWVLDRPRVQPLMERAYQKGILAEASLRFGVPQPLEPGIWTVPARVPGPPEFLLHLMVKEVRGEPRLDWETYEQEISQRFPAFAARPVKGSAEFRLVLERAHSFAAVLDESVAVRVATPGSPALADPVTVRQDLAPALADALPWNRRRRALVRLGWNTPPGGAPRLVLTELVKWEFLP